MNVTYKFPFTARGVNYGYKFIFFSLPGYFFGYVAATFFIANEPKPGVPCSVSVKIIDPEFERFFFNQHGRKDNKKVA